MRGIKIALIAILSGLVITLAVGMMKIMNGQWNLFGFSWGSNDWNSRSMAQAELQNTTEKDMTNVSELLIDCSQAPYDVYFLPGESDKLVIEQYFTKTLEADRLADITVEGSMLKLRQKPEEWGSRLFVFGSTWGYFKIYLPEEAYAALEQMAVRTSGGDISLPEWPGLAPERMKLRRAELSSGSGDIDIAFIKADQIKISSSSGDQTLEEAIGVLDMSASSGYVTVNRAKGNMEVSTSSGEIRLGEIDGSLKAGASSGDIEAVWINGNAKIVTSSGYITLGEVTGSLESQSSSGSQKINSVAGNLRIDTSSGDQHVKAAGGSVDMGSSSGLLRVESLSGKADFKTTSGGVTANFDKWGGEVNISSSSGDVKIGLPKNSGVDFKAGTSSGSINTPFDDQLSFDSREKNADGSVNGGGYRMDIRTTSGNVLVQGH